MVETDLDAGTKGYLERFTNGFKALYGLNSYELGYELGEKNAEELYNLKSIPTDSKTKLGQIWAINLESDYKLGLIRNRTFLSWLVSTAAPEFISLAFSQNFKDYVQSLSQSYGVNNVTLIAIAAPFIISGGEAWLSSRNGSKGYKDGKSTEFRLLNEQSTVPA